MQERFTISPQRFTQLAWFTLGLLVVVVITGAGVRLTRSGLGCPDWPKCHGGTLPPANVNSIIEYTNRVLSGLVSVVGIGVWIASFRRRPRRRDLTWISAFFPVFLVTEAALGALVISAGPAATAPGRHAGGQKTQPVNRLDFKGDETLKWAVHAHGHIAAA